jgi:guanylate kinase
VTVVEFKEKAVDGHFLEWKEVHGNFYATPLTDMEAMLAEGKVAILKIDVQGALTAMELRPDALSIFIMPPSWEELEHRIRSRATDSEEAIAKRLKNASDEIAQAGQYGFQVVNDDIEVAVAELERIVQTSPS